MTNSKATKQNMQQMMGGGNAGQQPNMAALQEMMKQMGAGGMPGGRTGAMVPGRGMGSRKCLLTS